MALFARNIFAISGNIGVQNPSKDGFFMEKTMTLNVNAHKKLD